MPKNQRHRPGRVPDQAGPRSHEGPYGHGSGTKDEDQEGEIGQHRDTTPADGDMVRGRRDEAPGHLKRQSGDTSARDYAPGRTATMDRDADVADVAPDELGEDQNPPAAG